MKIEILYDSLTAWKFHLRKLEIFGFGIFIILILKGLLYNNYCRTFLVNSRTFLLYYYLFLYLINDFIFSNATTTQSQDYVNPPLDGGLFQR